MNSVLEQNEALACWDLAGIQYYPALRKLVIGDRSTRLPPKPAMVLEMLVEAAPNPVTKTDLLDKIWARSFTGDAVVADAVKYLRKASNGDSRPALIETLHKLGYRLAITPFAIDTNRAVTTQRPDRAATGAARSPRRIGIGLPLVALVLGVVFAVQNQADETNHQPQAGSRQDQGGDSKPALTEADVHYIRGAQFSKLIRTG